MRAVVTMTDKNKMTGVPDNGYVTIIHRNYDQQKVSSTDTRNKQNAISC